MNSIKKPWGIEMGEVEMRRLFLVGCPRSGTTLLQSLLAAHSQMMSFPESHFYNTMTTARFGFRRLGLPSPRIRARFSQFLELIGHPEMRHYLPLFAVMRCQYSRAFIAVLDAVTRQENKQAWLEKTPRHLHYIDDISAFVPDSKFIHLIRNGEDVVASLYEVVNQYPDRWPSIPAGDATHCIERYVDRWVQSVELSRRYVGEPNHAMVRYEHLVETPEKVIKGLCEFISIPFEIRMLERYADHAATLMLPFETWKQAATQAIESSHERKFDELFNETQKRHISARVAEIDLTPLI
ncbi:sulfotransferase [Candidatus Entotheonella serta]|nr:sulfotransferase [Candidatus Entotheonella serta]